MQDDNEKQIRDAAAEILEKTAHKVKSGEAIPTDVKTNVDTDILHGPHGPAAIRYGGQMREVEIEHPEFSLYLEVETHG